MSDVDKLIEGLEEFKTTIIDDNYNACGYDRILDHAISTIKDLSALYDKAVADVVRLSTQDKWISCIALFIL